MLREVGVELVKTQICKSSWWEEGLPRARPRLQEPWPDGWWDVQAVARNLDFAL